MRWSLPFGASLVAVLGLFVSVPGDAGPLQKPSPAGVTPILRYDSGKACINGVTYTNDVLPPGVGEFGTNGLDRAYWGGTHKRTVGADAGSWSGFMPSWGRHQFDTYFGDTSDGLGLDPFYVGADAQAPGSPRALRIAAMPMPARLATSLTVLANDQWPVANATAPFKVPREGGTLTVDVANPNGAQNKWRVGLGYLGGAVTFIGTLTSGGAIPSGNGTGGSNPWTISNIHIYSGTPGTLITPGANDEGGFRTYHFPTHYAGALDTNVNQQYGFFVWRMRMPKNAPAISPAAWILETGGVGKSKDGPLRSEWDVAEKFADTSGPNLNAGNILWNSGSPGYSFGCGMECDKPAKGATGVYPWPAATSSEGDYHEYGVLISPGGPAFPKIGGAGGVYAAENSPFAGTTFFLDGKPIAGHIGGPDLTQGSPDKEIMTMFQVGGSGTWLDAKAASASNPWPMYMWVQWLRVYRPTASSCRLLTARPGAGTIRSGLHR
ncbi:MAG: hypothetical protein NVSMB5_16220 [Candidatus Velthaea sp.]